MKKRFTDFFMQKLTTYLFSVMLFGAIFIAVIILLFLSVSVVAFQWNQINFTSFSSHSVPSSASSTQVQNLAVSNQVATDQANQALSEAQQDINVSNNIIAWSGFFLAFIASSVAIAAFFGVHEFRRIQHIRGEIDRDRQEVNLLKTQISEQLDNLMKQFGSESQTFINVSYNLGAANDAYKQGKNDIAIKHYLKVLKLRPDDKRVMERLGRAYSNLNEMQLSIYYLQKALAIDPSYEPALRSLGLCYRYSDKDKSIEQLKLAIEKNPSDYEALDFLGLIYRDNGRFDDAIAVHEQALKIRRRPETQFYLSLLYSKKGDTKEAMRMAFNAEADLDTKDPDEELRPVWQIVIHMGVLIFEGKEEDAYRRVEELTQYITTQRICDAVTGHLKFLLETTAHDAWQQKFLGVIRVK